MKRKEHERIVTGSQKSTEPYEFKRSLAEIVACQEAEASYKKRKTRLVRRSIDNVFWWHMFDMLILGVPFAAVICSGIRGYLPDDQFGMWFIIAMVIWLIGFIRQQSRFSRLECPECDVRLYANEFKIDAPIEFRCERCKIIWDTGFTHGSGD